MEAVGLLLSEHLQTQQTKIRLPGRSELAAIQAMTEDGNRSV